MTKAIGIDLGTTYTVAAVIEEGRPKVIPNAEGQRLTPSVVAFTKEGEPLVGQIAKRQSAANPGRTILSIKRFMGLNHRVRIDERQFNPQEISSLILQKIKADAQEYLGERIEKAVITVPAYFNDRQRHATIEAGHMAGLDVIRIINEPTAAALAYALDREDIQRVVVWDLGGGTFDVSVLELEKGIFEVRAVSGNTWLGGDDYDQRVARYLAERYEETYGVDSLRGGTIPERLREAAEKAKVELSARSSTLIRVPIIHDRSGALVDPNITLTREKFQELTADLLQEMIPPTRQALEDAGLKPQDIDRIILVGGATRMPAVGELAKRFFGKDPYQSINPDEVVGLGAAIQAGMLLGQIDRAVLLDVLPLSLGVATQGGLFARIIRRNTPLPASESKVFTTATDNQTSVDIDVLQGERELAADNISLGHFRLEGIPPLMRGIPRIEVTFDADVDGIIHVSAVDLLTESTVSMKLVSSKEIRPEDMQRMIDDAEVSVRDDGKRREQIEAGIEADSALTAAEMALEELRKREAQVGKNWRAVWRAMVMVEEALASGESCVIRLRSRELRELLASIKNKVQKLATDAS